jgi:GTP-binding protein LepA
LTPKPVEIGELRAGEVGFFMANMKNVGDTKIGDTITTANASPPMLPGIEEVKPMVFAGIFPINTDDYENLRDAVGKLKLNDASFSYEPESSQALGFGFRCGFLGLLHMEIIQERLEREFNLELLTSAPGVRYRVTKTNGEVIEI